MSSRTESVSVDISNRTEKLIDLPEGIPALSSLYIYIAGSCNLACRHCWITPTFQKPGMGGQFLELDDAQIAIEEAIPLGLQSVKLTGGEPLLHPHIRELITMISQAGIKIVIETNGTLVDMDLALMLKSAERVSFISVSLDGATAVTHEGLRMVPGSFQDAIRGIKNLVSVGFHPQLICTLHRNNVAEMKEIVSLAEKLGCSSVKFNYIQRIGRGIEMVKKQGLDVNEVIQLNLLVEQDLKPNSHIPVILDIPMAFWSIHRLYDSDSGLCNVHNIIGILAGGELSLCGIGVTVPELVFGNIKKDRLRDVWFQNPVLTLLRSQIPEQLEGICGKCLFKNICQGHCIANNFFVEGRFTSPYEFCDIANKRGIFPHSRNK